MSESEFDKRAAATLLNIEQAVEASGADIDFENSGEILTLEFVNGSKIIINKHGVARQIWVAARSGGFHYGFVDNQWINDQGGGELMRELTSFIREQSGEEVDFNR